MRGRIGLAACILLTSIVNSAFAQTVADRSTPFALGRAALDAHDPTTAIAQFERVATNEGREWLAVALMMESRSPSDQYVERAFAAAAQARIDQPDRMRSRADLSAALRPGDMVIAYLVGETHAYAWAFDRDGFVGYPLPPSSELETAVTRARTYIDQKDQAGVQRIAEQLLPALLGPVEERLPTLKRLVFVTDGALQRLPVAGLAQSILPSDLTIVTTDYSSLFETLTRAQSEPAGGGCTRNRLMVVVAIVTVVILIAFVVLRRRPPSVS